MAGAAEGVGGRDWGSWSLMRAGEETPTTGACRGRQGGEVAGRGRRGGSCRGRSYKNRAPTGGR